ncbi:MAG: S24 family peptidase [Burkholderiales bacterium]|nr:MAG: S24 family peptidase [Burkholderiales bacterium]
MERELRRPKSIPIQAPEPRLDQFVESCASGESFALMVLGDSMLPEFAEGDIIVIEPQGLATHGSFVLAFWDDEWTFRQLVRREADAPAAPGAQDGARGAWMLRALDPRYPEIELADLSAVRGVVIQKSKPGRRRAAKRYVE